jgi:predicted ATPase
MWNAFLASRTPSIRNSPCNSSIDLRFYLTTCVCLLIPAIRGLCQKVKQQQQATRGEFIARRHKTRERWIPTTFNIFSALWQREHAYMYVRVTLSPVLFHSTRSLAHSKAFHQLSTFVQQLAMQLPTTATLGHAYSKFYGLVLR